MATEKSKPAADTPHLCLDADRHGAGMDASIELDALLRAALRSANEMPADETSYEHKMVLRGLLARMLQLNSSVIRVLGEDHSMSTERIVQVIAGAEVFH
jgi:hypothetical protein